MLAIPPQLAVAWFPKDEINIATSIAVSANNFGIGVGCALTPLMVHQSTSQRDIPNLLFIQVLTTNQNIFLMLSVQVYHVSYCSWVDLDFIPKTSPLLETVRNI